MSLPNEKYTQGVGQGQSTSEPVHKHDQLHGKHVPNVPPGPHLPNEKPAGTDPSPFKVGQNK